ncbi:unnamed protein product, partial [Rotaria magnacalcarata]
DFDLVAKIGYLWGFVWYRFFSVVEQEFPVAIHAGCMFHFNQAIHRKITHLGLVNDYLRNETVRDQCRQLMALSLIPIDEVKSQFQRLTS